MEARDRILQKRVQTAIYSLFEEYQKGMEKLNFPCAKLSSKSLDSIFCVGFNEDVGLDIYNVIVRKEKIDNYFRKIKVNEYGNINLEGYDIAINSLLEFTSGIPLEIIDRIHPFNLSYDKQQQIIRISVTTITKLDDMYIATYNSKAFYIKVPTKTLVVSKVENIKSKYLNKYFSDIQSKYISRLAKYIESNYEIEEE